MTNIFCGALLFVISMGGSPSMYDMTPVLQLDESTAAYDMYDMCPVFPVTSAEEETTGGTTEPGRIDTQLPANNDQNQTESTTSGGPQDDCPDGTCTEPSDVAAQVASPRTASRQQSTRTGYWRTGLFGRRRWVSTKKTTTTRSTYYRRGS